MEFHTFFFKIFLGDGKAIGENGNHSFYVGFLLLKCFYGIKAAIASTYQIFDDDHTLPSFKITFNLVLSAMFLRSWSYIDKWKPKCFGN